MASAASIEVEPRSEAGVISGNGLMLAELRKSGLEKGQIIRVSGDRSQRLTGIDSRVPNAGIIHLRDRRSNEQQCRQA
jgi:hypothetical protein